MTTKIDDIYKSNDGIIVRKGQQATYVYSYAHGTIFCAPCADFDRLVAWMRAPTTEICPTGYETLNYRARNSATIPRPHILGSDLASLQTMPVGTRPLLINWLITGRCNLSCIYCYAQDLMNGACTESDESSTRKIAQSILRYKPLAVVLTGGEPTLSGHFKIAIEELSKKTSVVVDTNGTNLTQEMIETFKTHKVHVRVSLDSTRPQTNGKTRRAGKRRFNIETSKSIESVVLDSLVKLSSHGIPVTVQTVATAFNYPEIGYLHKTLQSFSITKWRILLVSPSRMSKIPYETLIGDKTKVNRFATVLTKGLTAYMASHAHGLPIQFTSNSDRNSVVLVAPDGKFLTESVMVDHGKILIDDENPTAPTLASFSSRVNMHAHYARYLNF